MEFDISADMPDAANPITQEECYKERKWWFFLLSSIFTFLAGLFLVLVSRAFSLICCRKNESSEYSQSEAKKDKEKKELQNGGGLPASQAPGGANKVEFETTFMSEAKDWAGELISGQTTTGRILVSIKYNIP